MSRLERLVESLIQVQIRTERKFYENEKRWRQTDERFRQLAATLQAMMRSRNGRSHPA